MSSHSPFGLLLDFVKCVTNFPVGATCHFIRREANGVAHALARYTS